MPTTALPIWLYVSALESDRSPLSMLTYIVSFAALIIVVDAAICCVLKETAPTQERALLNRDYAGRWFALHAAWNMLIVLTSLEDCMLTLANPCAMQRADVDYNMLPAVRPRPAPLPRLSLAAPTLQTWTCMSLTPPPTVRHRQYMSMSLHLYHCIAPWFAKGLTFQDYMHHFLFAFFLGGFQLTWHWGPGSNWFMFFVTGLPGGLDYLFLAMVKNGAMDRLTEKRWNSRINTWCRAPGCMATAAWTYSGWAAGNAGHIPALAVAGTAILTAFNGQYYSRRVVENHAICKFESAADRKRAKLSHPHPLVPNSLSDSARKAQ